jgi:ABC-2 type transport system permease protein
MTEIVELWRFREVLLNLVRRNLKVRYKNSFLGFFWSLLNPLLQIGVWWFVFGIIMGRTEENYMAFLITGFLPWLFFSQTILDATSCVTQEMALVKKAYFPRIILPLSALLSNLVHLLFAFVVLLGLFAIWRVDVNINYWLVIPSTLLVVVFAYGLSAMLAAWSVYYSDVKFIVGNFIGLWFFLTPVLYSLAGFLNPRSSIAGHGWLGVVLNQSLPVIKKIYMADPITIGVLGYRSALLNGGQNPILVKPHEGMTATAAQMLQAQIHHAYPLSEYILIAAGVAVVTALLGHIIFRRLAPNFAERG